MNLQFDLSSASLQGHQIILMHVNSLFTLVASGRTSTSCLHFGPASRHLSLLQRRSQELTEPTPLKAVSSRKYVQWAMVQSRIDGCHCIDRLGYQGVSYSTVSLSALGRVHPPVQASSLESRMSYQCLVRLGELVAVSWLCDACLSSPSLMLSGRWWLLAHEIPI